MNSKIGPYILLGLLALTLIFILGVRYGQKVEKTNRFIEYAISLPTGRPQPTTAPLAFNTFMNKECGIKFLYPLALEIQTNSSESAILTENKKPVIQINCLEIPVKSTERKNIAIEEVQLKNKKIIAEVINNQLSFNLVNPLNGKTLSIFIVKNLYPLFEKSFEFVEN